jgi:transketolase
LEKGENIAPRQAFGQTLARLGSRYKDLVVLDADLSKSTKTSLFAEIFPDRFFDMGISEQDLMGTAAGLASAGMIPFASTFAIFATGRAWEQIRNSICYPNLPVKVVATHAGITVGEDGASHQAIEDIALMRVIPNMRVIVPADAAETVQAIEAVAADSSGPIYVRLGRAKVPVLFDDTYSFQIGKAARMKDGKDITIVACGIMVSKALEAGDELSKDGIDARILNLSTIKPLDKKTLIKAAKETKGIVTAEEHNVMGGMGGAVAELICQENPCAMRLIGLQDTFGESGKPAELMDKYGLTSQAIVKAAREILKYK